MKNQLKYKLIKQYPGSPSLGNIVEYCSRRVSWKIYNKNIYTDRSISNLQPDLFPEFWQLIIEETKVYKVLTWLDNYSTIESVLRLVDNVEFKIGETVSAKGDYQKFILESFDNDDKDSLKIITDYNSVVCYLEDLVKVVEKDYEILSLKCKSKIYSRTPINHDDIVECRIKGINNLEWKAGSIWDSYNNIRQCLRSFDIHSVKRLSDGEVFTVGDRFKNQFNQDSIIRTFKIIANTIDIQYYNNGDVVGITLKDTKKVKTPLFKTEDGVDIFEGDKAIIVDGLQITKEYTANSCSGKCIVDDRKIFSTKEAAEEYILMNKPCLSINDIDKINHYSISAEKMQTSRSELKELVKSKL